MQTLESVMLPVTKGVVPGASPSSRALASAYKATKQAVTAAAIHHALLLLPGADSQLDKQPWELDVKHLVSAVVDSV